MKPFALSVSTGMGFDKLSPNGAFKITVADSITPTRDTLGGTVFGRDPHTYARGRARFMQRIIGR